MPNSLRMQALKDANAYCANQGKQFRVNNSSEMGVGDGRFPEAEVQFLCLDAGHKDLTRPKDLERGADITIENRQR